MLNAGWGICGITSSLYALYQHRGDNKLAQSALVGSRMLAEIKTFLVTLQANHDLTTLGEIEAFTKLFPGFGGWSVKGYIASINQIGQKNFVVNTNDDKTYSLGLPPRAVVKYLRLMCNFHGARELHLSQNANEMIIGVRMKNGRTAPYNGLVHWMYMHNGTVYSWGQQFDSVTAADADFVVCCKIAIT